MPIALTSPSKYVVSVIVGTTPRILRPTPSARCDSSGLHGRARWISRSAWASPPIPLCRPSRYSGSGFASGTLIGIRGPSSSVTWARTQRHPASAVSR